MTTLGVGMSINDRETTWADVKPVIHPQTALHALSLSAWKLAGAMADEENPDWERVSEMQKTAQELEDMDIDGDECTCFLGELCPVCRTICHVIYDDFGKMRG